MLEKATIAIAGAVIVVLLGCAGIFAGIAGAGAAGSTTPCMSPSNGAPSETPPSTADAPPAPAASAHGYPAIGGWDPTQVGNAAAIIDTGARLGIPPRGWVIAVATAIQESRLRNLGNLGPANDHDSLGLFQQRPSQGWGTPAQITDPAHAAASFYQHLQRIPGWQALDLTVAAQAVQRSAYPAAYAARETDATMLVAALTGIVDPGIGCRPGSELLTGYTLPPDTPPAVFTAIAWALGQLGTPYHLDGDCTAAHNDNPAHQCDCSSLTMRAYRAAGITLPRSADDQSRHGQSITDPNQLLPGDEIFEAGADGTTTHPGHVGLYLGDNLVVEAPHTGDVVKISSWSGWASQWVAIRRQATWPSAGSP
jgi:cell wall-associated NlpC family hydrolase